MDLNLGSEKVACLERLMVLLMADKREICLAWLMEQEIR